MGHWPIFAVVALVVGVSECLASHPLGGAPVMHTNIALVNADPSETRTQTQEGVKIDLENLIAQAGGLKNIDDIEEDPDDRFITKRNGMLRPKLTSDDEWADDRHVVPTGLGKVLSRKKRCNDGGDAQANRARYARRIRRKQVDSTPRKTTTVKVIQNGQVISETVHAGPVIAQQPGAVLQTPAIVQGQQIRIPQQQPIIQYQQQPIVQYQTQPATIRMQQPTVQIQPTVQMMQQQPQMIAYQMPVQQVMKA